MGIDISSYGIETMNSDDISIKVDCSENIGNPEITVECDKSLITVKILLELKNGCCITNVEKVLTVKPSGDSPVKKPEFKGVLTPQDMVEKFKLCNGINDFASIVKPCW